MGGNSSVDDWQYDPEYGTMGVPGDANLPPGRDGAMGWNGRSGEFWLFGGQGVYPLRVSPPGYIYSPMFNDLWQFAPSTTTLPPAPRPVFSLYPGTYVPGTTLTISNGMANAFIYYTRDGTAPTTSSNLYTGAITLDSETVRAFAAAPGYPDSGEASLLPQAHTRRHRL
jgi:hypothetical protein